MKKVSYKFVNEYCQNENPLLAAAVDNNDEQNQKEVKDTVIRAVPNSQITNILANHNISLNQTKNAPTGATG